MEVKCWAQFPPFTICVTSFNQNISVLRKCVVRVLIVWLKEQCVKSVLASILF